MRALQKRHGWHKLSQWHLYAAMCECNAWSGSPDVCRGDKHYDYPGATNNMHSLAGRRLDMSLKHEPHRGVSWKFLLLGSKSKSNGVLLWFVQWPAHFSV